MTNRRKGERENGKVEGRGNAASGHAILPEQWALEREARGETGETYRNPRNVTEKASVTRDCGGARVDLHVQRAGVFAGEVHGTPQTHRAATNSLVTSLFLFTFSCFLKL